jgi:hypothetical protein
MDEPEEWRPVPHALFADLYEVSNLGRVRRRRTAPGRRDRRATRGYLLTPQPTKSGALVIALWRRRQRKLFRVRRLVEAAFGVAC